MGKLEINPKLQSVLTKLREAEVEFKEALCELEKREGVHSTGEMEDFTEGMSYCLSSVAGAIGSDARQSIRELMPEKK